MPHHKSWGERLDGVLGLIWKIGKFAPCFCFVRTVLIVQSVISSLSQGLEDDILEISLGWWADTAAIYCPGRPSQNCLKSMTKHCDRVEKTLCIRDVKALALVGKRSRLRWQALALSPSKSRHHFIPQNDDFAFFCMCGRLPAFFFLPVLFCTILMQFCPRCTISMQYEFCWTYVLSTEKLAYFVTYSSRLENALAPLTMIF